jgi:hypothetical protein
MRESSAPLVMRTCRAATANYAAARATCPASYCAAFAFARKPYSRSLSNKVKPGVGGAGKIIGVQNTPFFAQARPGPARDP